MLDVSQDIADPRPTQRTKSLLKLLHRLIDQYIGTELASDSQLGVAGMSPKLRATLELLLEGASEKAIAAKLGVRPTTVHENVGKIYRHFRVRSRAELMAYFIRRRPKLRWAGWSLLRQADGDEADGHEGDATPAGGAEPLLE